LILDIGQNDLRHRTIVAWLVKYLMFTGLKNSLSYAP